MENHATLFREMIISLAACDDDSIVKILDKRAKIKNIEFHWCMAVEVSPVV